MKVNGESIYGTTASPFKRLPFGKCTQKPGRLYLHVLRWPRAGKLLAPIANPVKKAYLLAEPAVELKSQKSEAGQTIALPVAAPDAIASVVAVEIEGPAQVLDSSSSLRQAADGSLYLARGGSDPARIADQVRGLDPIRDCIGFWLNPNDWVEWQFDVTKPGKFQATAEIASQGTGSFTVAVGDQMLTRRLPTRATTGSSKAWRSA